VLQLLARTIEERGGQVPCSRAELVHLRGIGLYTASAVLAVVFGQVEALVDVNMARLLGRFFGSLAGSGRSRDRSLQTLSRLVVGGEDSLRVNWAVLDFAALACRSRRLLCQECPLRSRCQYFSANANPNANLLPL
jgi:A/G-specific adenine glycosylase